MLAQHPKAPSFCCSLSRSSRRPVRLQWHRRQQPADQDNRTSLIWFVGGLSPFARSGRDPESSRLTTSVPGSPPAAASSPVRILTSSRSPTRPPARLPPAAQTWWSIPAFTRTAWRPGGPRAVRRFLTHRSVTGVPSPASHRRDHGCRGYRMAVRKAPHPPPVQFITPAFGAMLASFAPSGLGNKVSRADRVFLVSASQRPCWNAVEGAQAFRPLGVKACHGVEQFRRGSNSAAKRTSGTWAQSVRGTFPRARRRAPRSSIPARSDPPGQAALAAPPRCRLS